jgi:hypothetical protein
MLFVPKTYNQPMLEHKLAPWERAIQTLEEMVHLYSPTDMLRCLIACASNVYQIAASYRRQRRRQAENRGEKLSSKLDPEGNIGADDFFPMWLYVVAHARVPDMMVRLGIMEGYSSRQQKNSESGYYLTCLESALLHILSADTSLLNKKG